MIALIGIELHKTKKIIVKKTAWYKKRHNTNGYIHYHKARNLEEWNIF